MTARLEPGARKGCPPSGAELTIVQYDPKWREFYEAENRRIRGSLGHRLASIEHVGSSSVPGMGGRREIDILLGLRTMRDAEACVSRLRPLGYTEPRGRERYAGEWRFLTRSGPILFETAGGVLLQARAAHAPHGDEDRVAIRTAYIDLALAPSNGAPNAAAGNVRQRLFHGDFIQYIVDWPAGQLTVRRPPTEMFEEGAAVAISFAAEHCVLLET